MNAILIDVTAQTVTDIDLKPGLWAMYKAIGCRSVDRVTLNGTDDLWLDDEGLLHDPQPPKFRFVGADNVFAGNGLICGYTGDGHTISTTLRAELIRPMILFLGNVPVRSHEPVLIDWPL
ncbi:DUF3846 domain-containing protein [Spirosoma sordidisoli]|uniref:DUF3846 domain-containing protein n=1 Tax=Spirosoma sordidisoli TaxID=2502893 RepID=A0A4Q2UL92_9BACT|nr:hypothetical protein [Spirosoma sordidisoli]RYC70084.1 hypothetical protein EQG79_09440 [Spirosoma sordidisoli]